MGTLIAFSVVTILLGAFLSVWAHAADKNRGLRVALYVIVGGFSALLGLAGLAVLLSGVSGTAGVPSRTAGWMLLAVGLAAGLPLLPFLRKVLSLVMPLDPRSVPDMLGLSVLTGLAVVYGFATYVLPPDQTVAPVGAGEIVLQEGTFVVLGFLAVGTFFVRDLRGSVSRLGLAVPSARQVLIALLLVGVAFLITTLSGVLMHYLQPDLEREIEDRLRDLTSRVTSVPGALVLGVSAGVGEEILFRGAVQPRYGIIFTSLIFSIVHVQYGFSVIVLGVFFTSILFGIIRKRMNTTAAIITHAVYDIIAVLLGTG